MCAFAGDYAGLVAGRLIQGVGLGVVVPTVGVVIPSAIAPRFRGRAWGFFGTGHGFGVLLALLTLPSIAEAGGYRAVFLATAGTTAVFGAIALAPAPVRRMPVRSACAFKTTDLVRALRTTIVNPQVGHSHGRLSSYPPSFRRALRWQRTSPPGWASLSWSGILWGRLPWPAGAREKSSQRRCSQ